MRSEADIPGVVARPPLIYLGFLAVGLILGYVWPAPFIPVIAQYSLGAALIVLGAVILAAAMRQFRRVRTNVPTNRPTTALATDGLYRFARNPIYIALSLVYAGIGIAADSPWVLGLLLPILVIIRYGVIAREERYGSPATGWVPRAKDGLRPLISVGRRRSVPLRAPRPAGYPRSGSRRGRYAPVGSFLGPCLARHLAGTPNKA